MADQDAREQYVAGSDDYLLNVSDYLHNYAAVPIAKGSPFYVEMVNSSGIGVPLPIKKNNTKRANLNSEPVILGIRLMVNPTTLSVNMSKIVNRTQTMTAWIEDHWGEEMDTVTLQGSTAGFVIGADSLRSAGKIHQGLTEQTSVAGANARAEFYQDLGLVNSSDSLGVNVEPGLTTAYRRYSVSYREWKKLIEIFSYNGCIFDQQGFVKDRHFIRLTYDYAAFIGYFESVDTTEDAASPYRFTYNITFRAERTLYRFANRKKVVT